MWLNVRDAEQSGDFMDLVPEKLNGAVIFNLNNSCCANRTICGNCGDFPVAIHNWLVGSEVRYVLLDLQDEKEVCGSFLEELVQLAKRLRIPFLLVGVMDRAKKVLDSYEFTKRWPTFVTPEDAVSYLDEKYPGTTKVSLDGLQFGVPIAVSRPRNGLILEADGAEAEVVD